VEAPTSTATSPAGSIPKASRAAISLWAPRLTHSLPAATFTGEVLKQFQVEGHLLVSPKFLRFAGGRGLPFLELGGGFLRQLHRGNVLLDSGSAMEAGAGLKFLLRSGRGGFGQRVGLRMVARASHVRGGFYVGERNRTYPAGALGLFFSL
jgi:hypothetical protein